MIPAAGLLTLKGQHSSVIMVRFKPGPLVGTAEN